VDTHIAAQLLEILASVDTVNHQTSYVDYVSTLLEILGRY